MTNFFPKSKNLNSNDKIHIHILCNFKSKNVLSKLNRITTLIVDKRLKVENILLKICQPIKKIYRPLYNGPLSIYR